MVVLLTAALAQLLPTPAPGNPILDSLVQDWLPMTPGDVLRACLAGTVFTAALLSITQAYRIARVAAVAPFEYSYLVWGTLLGFLVFGDLPGPRTVFGAALVVGCGLYIIYREQQLRNAGRV